MSSEPFDNGSRLCLLFSFLDRPGPCGAELRTLRWSLLGYLCAFAWQTEEAFSWWVETKGLPGRSASEQD